jgi:hypothetical protein
MDRATMKARVERGATYLDERYPGWAAFIAVDRLDMYSSERCVLGHLYGSYARGIAALNWERMEETGLKALNNGFITEERDGQGMLAEYDELSHMWELEVRERQASRTGGGHDGDD